MGLFWDEQCHIDWAGQNGKAWVRCVLCALGQG